MPIEKTDIQKSWMNEHKRNRFLCETSGECIQTDNSKNPSNFELWDIFRKSENTVV